MEGMLRGMQGVGSCSPRVGVIPGSVGFCPGGPRTLAPTPPTRLESRAMEGAGACDGQDAGLLPGFVRFHWALLPIGAWSAVGVV